MNNPNSTSLSARKDRTFRLNPDAPGSFVREPGRHLKLHRCIDEPDTPSECDVILFQSAYHQIMKHLEADTTREHGGLLLGYIGRPGTSSPPTISIMASLPASHTSGTRTSLTFTEETWLSFQNDVDELERRNVKLQRVGWYHSHPGIAIFLSPWDLDVCTNFNSRHHVALVVDPIKCKGAFFPRGEHGYKTHEPRGFWEYPDLKPDSLIQWKNTYEVRREWMVRAHEVLKVEVLEDPDEGETPEDDDTMEDVAVIKIEAEQQPENEAKEPEPQPTESLSEVNTTEPDLNETVSATASESVPEVQRDPVNGASIKRSKSWLRAPRFLERLFDWIFGVS